MSKLDDRLAARQQQATASAQAASQPAAPAPAANSQSAETPAEAPAAAPPAVRPAKPARARTAAEAPAEMDKDVLDRWQWQLRATAGKAVAAQRRAQEAVQAWERLVADARHAGVPDRLPMAAALEADIDLPAGE